MTTKIISSQPQDILKNSTIKEEILIKSLVDEIFNAEEKISQINNSKDISQNGQNVNNQKLFELKSLQNNLQQKLTLLNNNYTSELSSKKNEILSKKQLLNDLDISIKENQLKLSSFNTINFKSPLLANYVLDNNDKILTQEQINDIFLKNKNKNEDELKQLIREIEINKAGESVIVNNKNEIKKKLNQVNENLKMIKEEKLSINDELIDIISFKESLECVNKNNLYNLIHNIKSKYINNLNTNNYKNDSKEDEDSTPIQLYLYELAIIDPNKAANKIYEELSDAFRIVGSYNNKKNNISYMTNDVNNKTKNNTNINFYPNSKNKEMNTIDIFESKKKTSNKDNYNDISHNASYRNKSLNNSCIGVLKENSLILDKNSLKNTIKDELDSFIKSNKNYYNNNDNSCDYSLLINNFLKKIALIINKQLKNNDSDIVLSSNLQNDLIIYLSFFFKILYYDNVIENKTKFINKEYKTQKKEYKKLKEIINNELIKLENKYDEIKAKKLYNENQLNILKNSHSNQLQNDDNYINLSPNEQSYIQTCIKINSILKQKEEIKDIINDYESDINNKKYEKNNEIENINSELERIKKEIDDINHRNELDILKNNEDIITYRKIIADKFNTIKEQLQLYKEKYGSNLSLYNKFINNINNSIQKTYNKSFFDLGKNKSDFLNYDNNNGIIINGGENKNNIDNKYINLNINKNFNILNSLNNVNLKNVTERFHENNSFNKSLTNNEENEISKNVNKILNKTISNLHQSSDYNNLLSNNFFLGDNKNHNIINNIKVEKINQSFYQYPSFSNKNKREKRANSQKKNNTSNNNFDMFNKELFNLNDFIKNKGNKFEEQRRKEKNKENIDGNSKTFSHPFFRKQSKSQGGVPDMSAIQNQIKSTKNNILNINLFRHKKNSSNSGIHKGIPRGSKITNDINIKNEQNIKNSIKNIKARLENNNNNNFLYKLNPLTKITFCYYREISSNSGNFVKYNPLKNISSKELCEHPYDFIKSTISLNKNYKSIKIVPSTQLEPIDFKIWMVENTVVSSAVKTIIDIHRNYYKWKENNKGNSIINKFIDEQIKKYNNLSQIDIEKCIINKNFNFSLIINNQEKEKSNKRIEFIICSYDEFKMWINGMAYIIKNKMNILKLINEKINGE